jgi:hypothetical protein
VNEIVEEQQGCDKRDEEFGRGQNTGMGWNDPETVFSCCPLSQPSHDAKVSPNARRNGFQRDVALHGPRVSFGNPFLNAQFLTAIAAVAAEHDIPALRRFAGVAAHVLPRRQIRPRRMCQPFLPCPSAVNASPFEVEFNHILPNIFRDAHLFPVDMQSFNHVVPRGHLSIPFDVVTNVFHDVFRAMFLRPIWRPPPAARSRIVR